MGDNSLLNIGLDHAIQTEHEIDYQALDLLLTQNLEGEELEVARQLLDSLYNRYAKLRQAAQTGLKTLREQRNQVIGELEQLKADMQHPYTPESAELIQMIDDLETKAKGEGYDKGYGTALENLRDEWVETLQNMTGMTFTEALTLAETLVSPDVLALEKVIAVMSEAE